MPGPHLSSGLGCIACRDALEPGRTAPREPVIPSQASDPGSPCTGAPASSAPSGPHQSPPHPEESHGIAGKKKTRVGWGGPVHRAGLDPRLSQSLEEEASHLGLI